MLALVGGVIRDSNGKWVGGFMFNIGYYSITNTELWGIYEGISLAWDLGLKKVQIETDSACAVEMILNHSNTINQYKHIISRIRVLINN